MSQFDCLVKQASLQLSPLSAKTKNKVCSAKEYPMNPNTKQINNKLAISLSLNSTQRCTSNIAGFNDGQFPIFAVFKYIGSPCMLKNVAWPTVEWTPTFNVSHIWAMCDKFRQDMGVDNIHSVSKWTTINYWLTNDNFKKCPPHVLGQHETKMAHGNDTPTGNRQSNSHVSTV